MIALLAVVLLDLAWVPDSELALRQEAARTEAATLQSKAAESDALLAQVEALRTKEREEKTAVEASLPTLGGTKKKLAESRVAELTANLAVRDKRVADLTREVGRLRASAKAKSDHASALAAEADKREREAKAELTQAEEEGLGDLPSARIVEAKAYHDMLKKRYATQVAALDGMLAKSRDGATTASIVARKNEVRSLSGTNDLAIERIADELRLRAGAKEEEAERLAALEQAAKARAEDAKEGVETEEERLAHSKAIDAKLDAILARQDQQKAATKKRWKLARDAGRWTVLGLFLVGGIVAVWYAVARKR